MKHKMVYQIISEICNLEEAYTKKEKNILSNAFKSAKQKPKKTRKKIIKTAFSKVSG